jgi:hypothetical protein
MAKQKNGVNKSEEIRKLLQANPKITGKEVVTALKEKGVIGSPLQRKTRCNEELRQMAW